MQITTVHTLAFTVRCANKEQQLAAMAIIKLGAASMDVTVKVNSLPLADGEDTASTTHSIQAMASEHSRVEHYWNEIVAALALIGVEATSP